MTICFVLLQRKMKFVVLLAVKLMTNATVFLPLQPLICSSISNIIRLSCAKVNKRITRSLYVPNAQCIKGFSQCILQYRTISRYSGIAHKTGIWLSFHYLTCKRPKRYRQRNIPNKVVHSLITLMTHRDIMLLLLTRKLKFLVFFSIIIFCTAILR